MRSDNLRSHPAGAGTVAGEAGGGGGDAGYTDWEETCDVAGRAWDGNPRRGRVASARLVNKRGGAKQN